MYELVVELFGHTADVRSLAVLSDTNPQISFLSGARDRILKLWTSLDEGKIYSVTKDIFWHEHWISAILTLPNGAGFVTGCQDHKVRLFDASAELIGTFEGHTLPVTSLAYDSTSNSILSGSWDGTAKIWQVVSQDGINQTLNCIQTLQGHENGVSVLALPNGVILTASAGINAGGKITGFQIRMWQKNDGDSDYSVVKVLKDHEGPIRSICLNANGTGFYSSSNDGSVILYDLAGNLQRRYQNRVELDGSSSFCYDVSSSNDGKKISTSNDDCFVRIWEPESAELLQEIPHPSTVWCSKFLPNGDLITGCSDGVVRVFSESDLRKALPETIQQYNKSVQETIEARIKKSNPQGFDPEKYPKIEFAVPGSQDGQMKLFNRNGVVFAYSWSMESGSWIEIGEAMGENPGGSDENKIDGVKYDKVLNIEVEDPRDGNQVRALKIGINNGDNPYVVATEFCLTNGLNVDNVQQIVQFINNQRTNTSQGITLDATLRSEPVQVQTTKRTENKYFPLINRTGFLFEKTGHIDKILDKVKEFNEEIPKDVDQAKLSEVEISHLQNLGAILGNTSMYHSSTIPQVHVAVLMKMLNSWEIHHIFPLFDLFRVLFSHPEGAKVVGDENIARVIFVTIEACMKTLTESKSFDKKLKLQVNLTGLQLISNIFKSNFGVDAVNKILSAADGSGVDKLLIPLKTVSDYEGELNNKNVRVAIATVCLNISNGLYHGYSDLVTSDSQSIVEDCLEVLLSILLDEKSGILTKSLKKSEGEAARRGLLALGCVGLICKTKSENNLMGRWSESINGSIMGAAKKVDGLENDLLNAVSDAL